ncbi:MAG: serine/threonine-protein kinase [Kofleriaceae bacterium]|nr:serine/threonine-protein kinase [Kofleriaceae bacterium]
MQLDAGTMLGKYEVMRKLATGGMAEIYLARSRGVAGFEKHAVVKRILPSAADDPRLIQMFLEEARLAATLQHPNIADVYEVGEHAGGPYFVMEHIHGQDVRSIRLATSERKQGVPLRISLAIVHAIASALDYAHGRSDANGANLNLVHRDISASNVLVSYEGAIKLIDFGVARVTNRTTTTQAGMIKGKWPYMSPEQVRGVALDRRSDLFSLGIVLYELTVGRRPFHGESDYELTHQIVHGAPIAPSVAAEGYPPALERIVLKLLAKDVDERYQDAEEILGDLDGFLDEHHLYITPKKISKYMQALFADRMGPIDQPPPRRAGRETPPTPLPVVMRLTQEIQAVALDADASVALGFDERNNPLAELNAESPAQPVDTITVRTGEREVFGLDSPSMVASTEDASSAAQPADTITVRTGEKDAYGLDSPSMIASSTAASRLARQSTETNFTTMPAQPRPRATPAPARPATEESILHGDQDEFERMLDGHSILEPVAVPPPAAPVDTRASTKPSLAPHASSTWSPPVALQATQPWAMGSEPKHVGHGSLPVEQIRDQPPAPVPATPAGYRRWLVVLVAVLVTLAAAGGVLLTR